MGRKIVKIMNKITSHDSLERIKSVVSDVLKTIEQEREKEIIARRFGLFDRKETLEQIGELLGITRERVRQLEKVILNKLKAATKEGKISSLNSFEKEIIRLLSELGRVARAQTLTDKLIGKSSSVQERAHLVLIATLAPSLTVIDENDNYHLSIGIGEYGDEKNMKESIDLIVNTIKKHGEPLLIDELHEKLNFEHPDHVKAYASLSKLLATLNDSWGLQKWPTVNPKNIRDKIFVILNTNNKPMHFADIAKSIKDSSFKRNNVTTQAIHNELIKDSRFVLVGRGIYALSSWGYERGTVSDIIEKVLKDSPIPLHRDEIVRRVLKDRQVKETTVLLNLQSKPQFKRVAKATYTFKSPEVKN